MITATGTISGTLTVSGALLVTYSITSVTIAVAVPVAFFSTISATVTSIIDVFVKHELRRLLK